jgi:hypothetical protein
VPSGTAYLTGGPCARQTKKITAAESDTGTIVCKGYVYLNDNGKHRKNGDIIFKYSGQRATTGGGVGGPPSQYAPNVYHSWSHLQHSVNRDTPTALHRIYVLERGLASRLRHKGRRHH